MKGSVVAVLSALAMVLVYVLTVSLLGSGSERGVLFMSGDSMAASDPLLVHRYLGFTALVIAMLHALYFGYRWWVSPSRMRKSRWDYAKRARERFPQPSGAPAATANSAPSTAVTSAAATAAAAGLTELEPNAVPHLDVLELNQELDVFWENSGESECARGVLVHKDAGHLVVRIIGENTTDGWPVGAPLHGYFWRSNDCGYVFESKLIENRQVSTAYLVLSIPPALEQKQRRMYVRASHRERVSFLHVPAGKATEWLSGCDDDQSRIHEGMVEDLSAGGFRMVTDAQLGNGDYISIDDFSPVGGEILARVSADLGSAETGDCGRYGLTYVGVDSSTREKITQAVFRLHREMLSNRSQEQHAAQGAGDA